MKILLVHNNYGKYSGEEAVVDKMAEMLQARGIDIAFYRLSSEGSRETLGGKIKGFLCGIHSPEGIKGMREALQREKPDVVNVHNLYPFISPAALQECRKAGVPVVMTVHNFRLICPTGLFMRNGAPCELCLERGNEWSCLRYNCEHSLLKSAGYTLRNAYARLTGAYRKNVDTFACITDFQRRRLEAAGFNPRSLTVIPNCADVPDSCTYETGEYIGYVGRLSYEKGYDRLIDAARRHPHIPFRFAGAVREDMTGDLPENVRLLGKLDRTALEDFIRKSRFIVMPSRCYEGFPMTILEAAAFGKPCIGPDHGGFTEIIGHGADSIGRLFAPASEESLERQITELWEHPEEVRRLGRCAYGKLKREYSTDVIGERWLQLFGSLCRR